MPELVLTKNGANGHHKFTLTVTETSYSIENNTSVVSFSLKISKVQSGYDYNWGTNNASAYTETVNINGTTYTAHNGKYDGSSVTTYISGTQTINHDSDGSKTITCSFSVDDKTGKSYTSGDASASGTLTLTTIPRASSFNASSYSGTLGTSMNITYTSASSSFNHTLLLDLSSTTIGSNNTSGSFTWTPAYTLASNNINSKTLSGTLTLITYNGSTELGRKTAPITLTMPNNSTMQPTMTLANTDVNGYSTRFGAYVYSKSILQLEPTASFKYGATLGSITYTIKKENSSGEVLASGTYSTITYYRYTTNYVGTLYIEVSVSDSRGFTKQVTSSVSVAAYSPPNISQFQCERDATTESTIICYILGNSTNVNNANQNTTNWVLEYKKTSSSTWINGGSWTSYVIDTTTAGNEQYITNTDVDASYDLRLTATDYFGTVTKTLIVTSSFTLMNFSNGGMGMAIGKSSESENLFECDLSTKFNKDTTILNNVISGNVKSKNLIDENNPILSSSATWIGNDSVHYLTTTATWSAPVTWWIPIKVGEQYAFKYKQRNSNNLYFYITEYDNIDGTVLRRIVNDGTGTSYTFTIQNNGYLAVRFNNNANLSNVEISEVQLERGSVVTSYTPYFMPLNEVAKELNGNESMGNVSVKSIRTKNLLGTKAFLRGRINETTGAIENQDRVTDVGIGNDYITITTNASWSGAYTDNYIEVNTNEIYNLNFTTSNPSNSWGSVYCYDSSKNFLGQATKTNISTSANYSIKIELKPNTQYARVVLQNTASGTITYSKLQLESGSSATSYTPYQDLDGSVLDTQLYYNNNVTSNLNYAFHNGMYFYGPDALNKPSSHGYGSVFVLNSQGAVHNNASNWCQQIAFPTDGHIYYRQKINSASWGNWQQIL